MVLVIPAIELCNGRCRRRIQGDPALEGYYTYLQEHPDELARLYRQENARSLHIVDIDAIEGSSDARSEANRRAIVTIAHAVDIPIELLSTFSSAAECKEWLDSGVFRLVVSDLVLTDPDSLKTLVERYTASRIVVGIRAHNRQVHVAGTTMDDVSFALAAKAVGIRRVVYSDVRWEGTYEGPDFDLVEMFARSVQMNITIAGGIDSPEELWRCNALRSCGVDSVIVGRAIVENRFPCQYIWRMVEATVQKNFVPPPKST